MASVVTVNTAEECACGMDFKRGTSVFAAVLGVGSLILIIICGVELSRALNFKDPEISQEIIDVIIGVLIFLIVLYGLHAISCGLVILAAKTGNRYLLIPWMVIGCILAVALIRSIFNTIRALMAAGDNVPRSTSFENSHAFQILVSAVYLILIFGFSRCVWKLFRILRAEKLQSTQQNVTLYPAFQPQPQFGLPTHPANTTNVIVDQPPKYEEEAPKTTPSTFRFAPTGYEQMPPTPYGV